MARLADHRFSVSECESNEVLDSDDVLSERLTTGPGFNSISPATSNKMRIKTIGINWRTNNTLCLIIDKMCTNGRMFFLSIHVGRYESTRR